jgi:hypothetical protein
MKDITLLFCLALAIVLGVTSLDKPSIAFQTTPQDAPATISLASTPASKPPPPLPNRSANPSQSSSADVKTQKLKIDVLNSSVVNAVKVFDIPVTCVVNQQGKTIQHIQGTFAPHLFVRQLQRTINPPTPQTTPASASNPSKENQPPRSASASPSK